MPYLQRRARQSCATSCSSSPCEADARTELSGPKVRRPAEWSGASPTTAGSHDGRLDGSAHRLAQAERSTFAKSRVSLVGQRANGGQCAAFDGRYFLSAAVCSNNLRASTLT